MSAALRQAIVRAKRLLRERAVTTSTAQLPSIHFMLKGDAPPLFELNKPIPLLFQVRAAKREIKVTKGYAQAKRPEKPDIHLVRSN